MITRLPLLTLMLFTCLFAQKTPEQAKPAVSKGVLLLERPVDNSLAAGQSAWLGAVAEQLFRFRLTPLVTVVAVEELIPGYHDLTKEVRPQLYRDLEKKRGVTHTIKQNYEIINKGKDVQYLLEMSTPDNTIVFTVEKVFPVDELAAIIDSAVAGISAKLGIGAEGRSHLFYRTALIGGRSVTALGRVIINDRFSSKQDPTAVAREYGKLTKERGAYLACFLGALASEKAKDYGSAAAMMEELLPIAGQVYPGMYAQCAENYRLAQRYNEALRVALLGEKNGIRSAQILLVKAQVYVERGDRAKAKEEFRNILLLDKNDIRALLFLAQQNNRDSLYQPALEMAERVLALQPQNGAALLERGRSLVRLKRTDAAIEALTKAASILGDDPHAHALLADLHAAKGASALAMASYHKAMKGMPENIPLHFNAAGLASKLGNPQEAMTILRRIEPLASGMPRLLYELGMLEIAQKDTARARGHLESYVKGGGRESEALLALAGIHANGGRRQDAIRVYQLALPVSKDPIDVKMKIARLLIADGKGGEALAYIKEVAQEKPAYPEVNRLLGDAALAAGDKVRARDHYLLERKSTGDNAYLQERLGSIFYDLKEWNSARTEYVAFTKSGKPDGEVFIRLTRIMLSAGVLPAAEEYLAKAASLSKAADADILLQFGQKYSQAGNSKKAMEYYQQCLALSPNSEPALLAVAEFNVSNSKDSIAAEYLVRLYRVDNDKHKAHLARAGELFEKRGKKDKAREIYSLYLSKHSDDGVRIRLGLSLFGDGKHAEALKVLEEITGPKANSPEVAMPKTESYIATDQCSKALPVLETLLRASPANARALILAAGCYEKSGSADKAIAMYERFLATPATPKHSETAYYLGGLYEKAGRKQNARALYAKNTALYPQDSRNFERHAVFLMELKDYTQAIPALQKAIARPKASPQLQRLLAQAYLRTGDKANAARYFAIHLKQSPNDTDALSELGTYHFNQKQYPKAIESFLILATLAPNNFDCRYMLGVCYVNTGKHAEAALELSRAHKLNDKHENALALLLRCQRALKDTSGLVESLRKLSALKPNDFEVKKETGDLLLATGKLDDAIATYGEAVRLRPAQADMHLTLAELYRRKGVDASWLEHLTLALKADPRIFSAHMQLGQYHRGKNDSLCVFHHKRAVELDPKNGPANYEYGTVLVSRNQIREAVPFLAAAAAIDGNNVEYLTAHALALRQSGAGQSALPIIKKALAKEEKNATLLEAAGILSFEAQQFPAAKDYLTRALGVNRNCATCYDKLGDIAMNGRNLEEGAKQYELARAVDSRNPGLASKLSKAYFARGNFDKAEKELEGALALDSSDQEAAYLLGHLHLRKDELSKASILFDRLGQVKKKVFWYYLFQGELNEAKGLDDAAHIGYSSALRMSPENPQALAGVGRMHLKRGNPENALMVLSQALAFDENNPHVIRSLGSVYEAMKDDASALKLYKEALRLAPNDPEMHFVLARHESKRGNHAKSLEYLSFCVTVQPQTAKFQLALGFEYAALKRWGQSVESFRLASKFGTPELAMEANRQIGNIYFSQLNDSARAREAYALFVNGGGKDETIENRLRAMK